MDMETPKSSGHSSAGPKRLALSATQYRRPFISSPLATSSPMAFGTSSMDRPSRRPPPMPAQTGGGGPSRAISFPATQIHQQQFSHQQQTINDAEQRQPGSHTNTMRSTDLSTLFTTPEESSY